MRGYDTKRLFNLVCGAIALFCFVSLFIPVIAPCYPATNYYSATGASTTDFVFSGDYYYAREYWSISQYVFSTGGLLARIVMAMSEALLIYWAFYSVKGEAGKMGMAAAALNLVVVAVAAIDMLGKLGSCRWSVLAVVLVDAIVAAALAANVTFAKRG